MKVTRRGALIGSAGLGVGALGVGAGRLGWLPHEEPPAPAPVDLTQVEPGKLHRGRIAGAHWWISLPPGASGGVPVVVALHGQNGSADGLLDALVLDRQLAASGQRFALAAIDGGAEGFWHPRSDGRDPLHLLVDGFLPGLKAYGLEVAGLIGWSMGGYGALLADTLLERHVPVCAVSPAVFPTFQDAPSWAYDGSSDFERWDLARRWNVPAHLARVDCGREDALYPWCRSFAREHGIAFHGRPGAHDFDYWSRVLPDQLAWLGARLA